MNKVRTLEEHNAMLASSTVSLSSLEYRPPDSAVGLDAAFRGGRDATGYTSEGSERTLEEHSAMLASSMVPLSSLEYRPPTSAEEQRDKAIAAALQALITPAGRERGTPGCILEKSSSDDMRSGSSQQVDPRSALTERSVPTSELKYPGLGRLVGGSTTHQNNPGATSRVPPWGSLITFSVEPFENNTVLYLRVAPFWKGIHYIQGMLYFHVKIVNTSSETITLTTIDVSFPNSAQTSVSYPRKQKILAGQTRTEELFGTEPILLVTTPTKIMISLTFLGMNKPKPLVCDLAPHQVSYPLFTKPVDIETYGEYVILQKDHQGGGGSQHFAYDVWIHGWVKGVLKAFKTNGVKSDDYFLFGRPIYSMKAGKVLFAVDRHVDNPKDGLRAVVKMKATWQSAKPATDIAVACLSDGDSARTGRILIAWLTENIMKLTALKQTDVPDEITEVMEVTGPAATSVEIIALSAQFAVTATRNGTTVQITLWEVTAGGVITEHHQLQIVDVTAVKLLMLSSTRFVIATYGKPSQLTLAVWDVDTISKVMTVLDIGKQNFVPDTSVRCDLVFVDNTRFVTVVSQSLLNMGLRVIVWNFVESQMNGVNSFMLFPIGQGYGPAGDCIGVAVAPLDHFGIVVREYNGTMRVQLWKIDPGTATFVSEYTRKAPGTMIAAAPFKGAAFVVMSRTQAGKMLITALATNEKSKPITIVVSNDEDKNETLEATNMFCAAMLDKTQPGLVTVSRAVGSGIITVNLWEYTWSNLIYVLHGNELVYYGHLKEGSIPKKFTTGPWPVAVNAGDLIGRMGNSGKSSGPHLHIQVDRVGDEFLNTPQDDKKLDKIVDELKKLEGGRTATLKKMLTFRPLQFENAKVALKDLIKQGGAQANPFLSEMDGEGGYFFDYAVLPSGPVKKP